MTPARRKLPDDTLLWLGNKKYRILQTLSENGGSCIVYTAECTQAETIEVPLPNEPSKNKTIQIPATKAVIKEFYPKDLLPHIVRCECGRLTVSEEGVVKFNEAKARFINGVAKQIAFYDVDSNHSMMGYPEIYQNMHGTAYSVLGLTNGITLSDIDFSEITAFQISEIMVSLCNAVKKLHAKGRLYLDIKPDNVFLFDKEKSESRRIALFDFDTVVEKGKLPPIGFYSLGWAANEQALWQTSEISEATDIYSIGALFYWLISGKEVTEELLDDIQFDRFEFLDECPKIQNMKNAKETAKKLLRSTLVLEPELRVQSVEVLV